jgi:hypothetical protein
MAVDNNSFFQYNETRAQSGYKSAWLVKRAGEDKYSLVGATETVPYVFGDKDTFEFDILQSPTKGQVEGKMSLEPQDIEVLHHRDNAYRFGKLKDAGSLDFMVINAEFVGYKFVGTLDYRPNNAEADVNRATVTITPMSAQTIPVFNARPEVEETLCFASAIPATIKVNDEIDLSVTQSGVTPTVTAILIADGTNEETDATASVISTDIKNVSISTAGLYALTVSAKGYASWTTTVYVEA